MQRSQIGQLFSGSDHLFGNQSRSGELGTALNYTVADSADCSSVLDNSVITGGEQLNNFLESLSMGGELYLMLVLVTVVGLVGDFAADADLLAQALSQYVLSGHVDQLILQRGAAGIDN